MSAAVVEEDADPIRTSYDVYINPPMPSGRSLYILQFPNRSSAQAYSAASSSKPSELRIKPKSGLLELDVPVDARRNYDRVKGVQWGEAIRKSNLTKGGGSHGLPGGFGIGGSAGRPVGRGRGAGGLEEEVDLQERLMADYENSIATERVLTKQTLGGQTVPHETASPQYMIGAFRKNQLHLTPVSNIVQMRPQFHHIDASNELQRAATTGANAALNPRPTEARAIHMTVKATGDDSEDTTDNMGDRIRSAQEESWRKYIWQDEDSEEAWSKFEEVLFVDTSVDPDVNMDAEKTTEDEEGAGKGVLKLVSVMSNAEYLDAISAPRDAARLSRSKRVKRDKRKEKGKGKAKGKEGETGSANAPEDDSSSTLSDPPSDEESSSEEDER